ncbi:S-layer homology domain-containing protein [Anaerovorax sp. IOR16]|uniref:S-layer homology domain-containing protein n=1 Tax=Anaerovorax sp. IOR16 TaxID=2773458 RepID=UPI0019D1BDAF|nr:S-layer homology domain-containing protein [Anaerovorax sp. IOR16]
MQSKFANKVLTGILSVCLMLQVCMPVAYAEGSNKTPTVDIESKSIYANGTPITIEAGTLTGGVRNTKIKYNNGTNDVYLDLNPNEGGIQQEANLSEYKVFGGSNPSDYSEIENTSITMIGGRVRDIYGGGHSPGVSGDTHINISGNAEVCGDVYGGGSGNEVLGTAYITITGGDISQDHAGMVSGGGAEWGTVGRAEIKITGGKVNKVMVVAQGGGNVTGDKTALITVPVWVNDREFTNALYKTDTQWIVKGDITLTDDLKITIAENETMIVSDGSNLTTNENLTNNGTIIKKGTITGDVSGTGSIVLTPIVDDANKAVYANGIPITILAGTSANQSKISYGEGLYVDFNGNSSKDLTGYSIYGGSNSEQKINSNIKMTGGSVENIYGQGKGYAVQNTNLLITGGTVSGTIEGGGEISTDSGYIEVVSNALKLETFDSLLYKEEELKWKIKGEYTILEKDDFWVDSNETLEIPENAILIVRGELTNKGTIINNGKIIGVATGNVQGTGVVCTEPVIDKDNKVIYGNGVPIIIEKGSDSEHSKIKYYDGTSYTYLKIDNSEDLLIKDYRIDGGAAGGEVRKTSIIINGGNINCISGGNATESVDIIVTGDVIMPADRENISCGVNKDAISNLYVYYEGTDPDYMPYPSIDNSSYGFNNIFCYYPNIQNKGEDWKPEIIKGKAVIPKGYKVVIPNGKTMTIPRGSTLTIEGTLINDGSLLAEGCISEESTGTLQGSGIFKTTMFTADDIQAIPDQLYTGNLIMPAVTVNSTRTFMGKVFSLDTSSYTKSYENNTNTGVAKVVFTSANGTAVEKAFNIVKSGTIFDGGIKTYKNKDNAETNTFTYGDTITVSAKPKATGTASRFKTRSLTAPTTNQMALFITKNGVETQISDPVDADGNGVYTMYYDTKNKNLAIGSATITAKYVGNTNMADYSGTVTVTLNKKAITSAVVNPSDTSVSKEYDGTNSFTSVALTLNSSDILSGDTVTATAKGTVADADAGTGKTFMATSAALDGDDKDYYSLDKAVVSGNVSITQAVATGVNQELPVLKGLAKEHTFDLTKLLPDLSGDKSFGDISYMLGTVTNTENVLAQNPVDSDIADGKITLNVANVTDKDKTATIQIKVASKNYKDFTADLKVKTIDKTPLSIDAVFESGTYNGKPYAYLGTPTFKNGTEAAENITYTAKYAGREGTIYDESETAPKDAGKYNLILTVSGESAKTYAGTAVIGFEITKKQITAKPNDVSIKSNVSFPAFTWNIETGITGETLTATNEASVLMEAQEKGVKLEAVKVGEFDIVFTTVPVFNQNGDAEKNYDIQIGKGKLTVTKHSSGGGSSSKGKGNSNVEITEPDKNSGAGYEETTTTDFADIANHWAKDAIAYVTEKGYFSGTTSTTFSPNKFMTRGMVVTVLYRVAGEPSLSNLSNFSDVNSNDYYAEAVAWCESQNIVKGVSETNFSPNTVITREQLSKIIYEYAKSKGMDVSKKGDLKKFTDAASISEYAEDAVSYAVAMGIISGRGNNTLDTKSSATRAEFARILQVFLEAVEK